MAFENVRLTLKERKEIAARKIKNPYGSVSNMQEGINPKYLTIDKESGTWLAWCYSYHDVDEVIKEFLFMYQEFPITLQTKQIYGDKNSIFWTITRLDVPGELLDKRETIKELIVVAFKTFKAAGWPEEKDEKMNIKCSFAEEV